MGKIYLIRLDSAHEKTHTPIGVFINSERNKHDVHLMNAWWRPEGLLSGAEIIPAIYPDALITITESELPFLGDNQIKFLLPNGTSTSKVMQKLGFDYGQVLAQLDKAKKMAEASVASKDIAEKLGSKRKEEIIEKEMDAMKKLQEGKPQMTGMLRRRPRDELLI